MTIAIDDSKWPVLLITFPAEGNEEDVDVFLRKLRTMYARDRWRS